LTLKTVGNIGADFSYGDDLEAAEIKAKSLFETLDMAQRPGGLRRCSLVAMDGV
jgi:hypothetical protein